MNDLKPGKIIVVREGCAQKCEVVQQLNQAMNTIAELRKMLAEANEEIEDLGYQLKEAYNDC